jgi:hypothetical protein
MKNYFRIMLITLLCLAYAKIIVAEQVHTQQGTKSTADLKSTAAGCLPGGGFKYMDINNVRFRVNTGGDMWWNFEVAQYEIPKGSKKMSMFSASLWIGGIDVNDQLKLAALRYRQGPLSSSAGTGNDYWPGPLTTDGTAAVTEATCAKYDNLFPITRAEVDEYLTHCDTGGKFQPAPGYVIPDNFRKWPAHGDESLGQSYYLAPFYDADYDGTYDPEKGDYPYYDVSNKLCHTSTPTAEGNGILADQVIKGDATLWWVFNDKGNIHTETQGSPIGLEIRGQAFAFATNDELNNMTFYSYEIINRSTYRLRDTYFSQWVDTDLGFAEDDYVGCDVERGLGYCYNGKPKDGTGQAWAYGDQPPAIGVDFFQGPYMDVDGSDNPSFNGDGKLGPSFHGDCSIVGANGSTMNLEYGSTGSIQNKNFIVRSEAINGVNFGNGIVDDERFGMRRFVFHTNKGGGYDQDPKYAPDYYNLLKGIWNDGTRMIYGGKAHASAGGYGPVCDFMFPGDSDPCNWGTAGQPPNGPTYWTEATANNPPEDRRFMQSAGPFTLEPGAVNYITVGIPWARAASGGPFASVELLRVVDDKCQDLFDNCFKVVSGPNAPDLTIREMDKELIIYISNRKTFDAGNNFNEGYVEIDPSIKSPDELGSNARYDSTYNFEGYMVYQLLNSEVSIADIHNEAKARLVFQCDVKNDVSTLVNYNFDQSINASVPVQEVSGSNTGIVHSFTLKNDAFADRFINHKQYYFLAVAYGFNEFMKYSDDAGSQVSGVSGLLGQKKPFLLGRKNIKVYTGIPHITVGTTSSAASYGEGPVITRIQGQGNGGNMIDLSDESIAEILTKQPTDSILNPLGSANYPISYNPTYKKGHGPVNVKVIDPLNVKDANYTIRFDSLYYKVLHVKNLKTANDTVAIQTAMWSLIDNNTGRVYKSDTTITVNNEQLFPELGLSVSIQQVYNLGLVRTGMTAESTPKPIYSTLLDNNGLLESSIVYADSSRQWYSGVPDIDGGFMFDWIRSGTVLDATNVENNDWDVDGGKAYDPNGDYEKIISGTIAPYFMTAYNTQTISGPAIKNNIDNFDSKQLCRPRDLASVDIVMTPDKSKWTRCPVIEMCADTLLAEGHKRKFAIRAGKSVNVNGETDVVSEDPTLNSNYIAATGMGWFPGYAINIETGERLNIMFSENSWLVGENGRDMLFNPTSRLLDNAGNTIFGGQHYFYVMAHTEGKKNNLPNLTYDCPAYDAGANLYKILTLAFADKKDDTSPLKQKKHYQYSNAMYVGMSLSNSTQTWLSNEMKMRIRVQKPYHRYYSSDLNNSTANNTDFENRNFPLYNFETKGIATVTNNVEKAKSDLDLINVVPNPYYAYSNYEVDQLDNRIKITNLPQKCIVTIYSANGTIIRQYNKDESKTSIDWDLKNSAGIPISGGIYLIHIKSDGIGERVIKFFGALRPVDFNAYPTN